MTSLPALEALNDGDLIDWIQARMRGDTNDPPFAEDRYELPDDILVVAHQAASPKFRTRLEHAITEALRRQAGLADLSAPATAKAINNLAGLCRRLQLVGATPTLDFLATSQHYTDPDSAHIKRSILAALSVVQPRDLRREFWRTLWHTGPSHLWAIALTGLRRCSLPDALAELPLAASRGATSPDYDVGLSVWGFYSDPACKHTELIDALAALGPDERTKCAEALTQAGASPEFVASLREPPTGTPWWCDRTGKLPTVPPSIARLTAA